MAVDLLFTPPGSPSEYGVDEFPSPVTDPMLHPIFRPASACSQQAMPLPPPSKPPDAEDWATYRSTIINLYLEVNLPLSVVRRRMRESYGFIASEKMYKDRFKKWNAHKNYSQEDIDGFLANITQDALKDTIHGQPVRWDRIKRRFSSSGVQKRSIPQAPGARKRARSTSSTASNKKQSASTESGHVTSVRKRSSSLDSATSPVTINLPTTSTLTPIIAKTPRNSLSVYNTCRTFSMLQHYLDERLFSADLLEQFFGPVEAFIADKSVDRPLSHRNPSILNQNYARGIALLRDNRVKLASSLLAQASDALEHLVVVHHPAFASCFLDAFLESKHELTQGMSGYVRDLAVKTSLKALGSDHPITVLCRFVQGTGNDDEQMEQLLFFCGRFCQLFSDRLGKQHKVSAHVNLKHFAKLLQMQRLDQAYTQFVDNVEPAFIEIVSGTFPRTMRAACLCYLRRKAHLLSMVGNHDGAEAALRQCVNYAMDWLEERNISVAGNPLMEECFRLIDEIGEWILNNGHTGKGIDLHSFAIGLCAAVRGEREGKAIRMISAQLARYEAAGYHDRVRIMQVRFPNVFADESDGLSEPTDHILPCPTCANGPDTQLWCEEHRLHDKITTQDKVFVRLTRECLADLLKWFGMLGD